MKVRFGKCACVYRFGISVSVLVFACGFARCPGERRFSRFKGVYVSVVVVVVVRS